VTVFALDELSYGSEEFLSDVPGGGQRMRRPAGGYRYTIVDGAVVQEDGKLTGNNPGAMLDAGC
jgi:N-acyl-D-aspartate/D-glutamate deacylase